MGDIKGYEGLYAITSCGRVWSYRSKKFLKPRFKKGYYQVVLYKDGKSKSMLIHRLVAESYIPNPNKYPFVNHKNEVKTDNYINNLEWCTKAYNNTYGDRAVKAGTKTRKKVRCIESGEIYDSVNIAAEANGVKGPTMSQHLTGKHKSCAGLHFEYYKGDES